MSRLLLGRYAIGESRGFYTHEGYLDGTVPVSVTEVPSVREETQGNYYSLMEDAVAGLRAPVHNVIVLVKYSPLGFGGFRLDKERNIPEIELLTLKSILGDGIKDIISVVVTNWSRQFARISDRRQRGVSESIVLGKLKEELAYSLSVTTVPGFFMDTVFWRTEQKSGIVPNTLPTTLETLEEMIAEILKNHGYVPNKIPRKDEISVGHNVNSSATFHNYSTRTEEFRTSENIGSVQRSQPTQVVEVDSVSDSSDDDMETKIQLGERWRNKKFQDLSANEYRSETESRETSTLSFPVHKKVDLELVTQPENHIKPAVKNGYGEYEVRRAVPVKIRTRSSSSSSDEEQIPVNKHRNSGNNY